MARKAILDRFIQEVPLAVMTRCIVGQLINEELDAVFEQSRSRQYESTLKFSAVAASVADVTLGSVENFNQAYRKHKQELETTVEGYYGKINRTETSISESVVRFSAGRASKLLREIGCREWEVLPGYRCSSLDGNHLQKTEKRISELRGLCAAPLPGTIVARFDLQSQLFTHAYLLEDAHAQESTVLDRALDDVKARDLLLADRHFCIVWFLLRIAARRACFVIRQHGRLKGELLGKRRKIGRCASGVVYEQRLRIGTDEHSLVVRRVTIELNKPTRDGDKIIHILSNVPAADATACRLADLYHQRWEIENAFHVLTMTLTCEVKSIGNPRAALFLFCMAMLAFNCRQILLGALFAEHDQEDVEQMSQFNVARDICSPMDGMLTAINEQEWDQLVPRTVSGCARFLRTVSGHVDVKEYRKSVRGPKKPPPTRKRCKVGTHVSTHRLLQERKRSC